MYGAREEITRLIGEGSTPTKWRRHWGSPGTPSGYHLRCLEDEASSVAEAEAPAVPVRARWLNETRLAVERLLAEGLTRTEIATRLDVGKATVSYHARRLGATIDERCARRYDWRAIQVVYDAGLSVRECAALFGFSLQSWHAASL